MSENEFQVVKASLTLSIAPVFSENPRAGVNELLDSMAMRYIPPLQGVLLSHSNVDFADKDAVIHDDCPFLVCSVVFDATLWNPRVGLKLSGKVNMCSPDHISLLVHRTFNVSVPRYHIPTDTWEFDYNPTEDDAELNLQDENAMESTQCGDMLSNKGGKWVHRVTGEVLGLEELVEFTVIGFTVANEMLSLLGSMQPDPFSPLHQNNQRKISPSATNDVAEFDVYPDSDSFTSTRTRENVQSEPSSVHKFLKKRRKS